MGNFSFRSCSNINKLLIDMFPNSKIVKGFKLGKTNIAYFINFVIALHFKTGLIKDINSLPFYAIFFDVSMNCILRMNLQIRFWNNHTCITETCYLDSQFILCLNADNLLASLN